MNKQIRTPIIRGAGAVLAALTISLGSSVVIAGGYKHNSFSDHAYVTNVQPIYRTVRISTPQEECWEQEVYHQPQHVSHGSAGSTIVGGIIGGVIGHQIGKKVNGGRGKNGGAILGTLIGAAVGHEKGGHKHVSHGGYTTVESHCETVETYHTEERVEGYRVTYEYNGEVFHTRMKHHPGDRIRVKVQVTPSAY